MKQNPFSVNPGPESPTIFSCWIAIVLALIYLLSRLGFNDLHILPVIETLGVSLFVLCMPRVLHKRFAENRRWFLNDSAMTFFVLTFLILTGMLLSLWEDRGLLKWLIGVCGYALFAQVCMAFGKEHLKGNLITSGVAIFFSVWVAAIFWGYGIYSPMHFESFAVTLPHVDSLFHTAIAEMIRTYGVPSIGIQGLAYFPYHFGSHFLFAQLSRLLSLDMLLFYPLAFPVIFLPLFFKVFLQFVFTVREKSSASNKGQATTTTLFWTVFFWGFIGVVGFNYLNRAGTASYAVLLSESYSLSLTFFFILMDICLRFWRQYATREIAIGEKIVFVFLALPVLLLLIGVVKISTLYIALALCGYAILRLRLFMDIIIMASLLLTGILSIGLLFLTYQFQGPQGDLQFFHYFKEYITVPAIAFIPLFYWWIFVLAFLLAFRQRSQTGDGSKTPSFFPLELALVAALAGLVPATVLALYGGSANYFIEPQYWIALSFTLCNLTSLERLFTNPLKRRKIFFAIAFLGVALLMFRNFNHHYNRLVYKNLSLRKYISDQSGDIRIPRRKLLAEVFDRRRSLYENISRIMVEPQRALHTDPEFIFFKKVRKLSETSHKATHFLFIENKHGLYSDFSCNAIPLAIPALTGMATLYGIPYDYCPAKDYGFDQFPLESRTEIGRLNKPEELCHEVRKNDGTSLIILSYNSLDIKVDYFDCRTFVSR